MQWGGSYEYYGCAVPTMFDLLRKRDRAAAVDLYWKIQPARLAAGTTPAQVQDQSAVIYVAAANRAGVRTVNAVGAVRLGHELGGRSAEPCPRARRCVVEGEAVGAGQQPVGGAGAG